MTGLIWFLAGVGMLFLELAIPGIIFCFFGAGAIITAIFIWIGILPVLTWQLIVFISTSLILLLTLRKYLSQYFKGNSEEEEDSEYVGKTVIVTRTIIPGTVEGRIFLDGTEWKATSDIRIEKDTNVIITQKKNITFSVEPK